MPFECSVTTWKISENNCQNSFVFAVELCQLPVSATHCAVGLFCFRLRFAEGTTKTFHFVFQTFDRKFLEDWPRAMVDANLMMSRPIGRGPRWTQMCGDAA